MSRFEVDLLDADGELLARIEAGEGEQGETYPITLALPETALADRWKPMGFHRLAGEFGVLGALSLSPDEARLLAGHLQEAADAAEGVRS